MNGETIKIIHVPPAHTDGDSIVHFEKANVIHAGDTFFNGFYPFMDVEHGGSIAGVINAANIMLNMADDNTKIIPGHGPLANKTQLTAYRDMLMSVQSKLAAAIKNNQSADQAAAADILKTLNEKWGNGFLKPASFVKIAYASMKK